VQTTAGQPGSQANRVSSARATALFVQDTIEAGRCTVVPGLRFESIDFERVDYADPQRSIVSDRISSDADELIPGVGVDLLVGAASHAFLGIHRGFAPPSPGQQEADAEESVNYEAGYRYSTGEIHAEAIGFLNDYSNLLGTCTEAVGCSGADVGDQFNGGQARTWGVEARAAWELTLGTAATRVPFQASYTWTRTEFLNSFESDYEPWGDVEAGDEFPYVPRQQAAIGVGLVQRDFSVQADVVYFHALRTQAGQGPIPASQATDSATLLELTVGYSIRPGLRVYAQGRNLTDEAYVAARQPAGARPGLDRALLAGVRFDF